MLYALDHHASPQKKTKYGLYIKYSNYTKTFIQTFQAMMF